MVYELDLRRSPIHLQHDPPFLPNMIPNADTYLNISTFNMLVFVVFESFGLISIFEEFLCHYFEKQ